MLKTIGVLLAGLLIGGGIAHEMPALLGAVAAWLLWRQWQQQQAIAELRRELLQRPLTEVAGAPPAAQSPPVKDRGEAPPEVAPPEVVAEAPPPPLPEPAQASARSIAEPSSIDKLLAPVQAPPLPAEPAPHSIGDRAVAAIKAWLFGGNTIVKAGVAILFVGLAFLAKYASEHAYVPPELRLAGIGAVALAMLALGWRLRASRPGYAQVVQGGAVAVLYLTLFVAFRWYAVIGALPVFVAMVAVALLAAALAVLQDAMALAVVGAAGGFATPLLVSTGQGDPAALFGYYLVLDIGIVIVAWFRTWRPLTLVGFAGTYIVATTWGVLQYSAERYAMSQAFLIAYFLVFALALVLPARRATGQQVGARWMLGSLLFGLPTITFVLQVGLVRHTEYGAALSALVLAAFYVALAFAARTRPALAALFESALAIATVFVTLIIPFALDARSTAGAWALEGAGLVWLGLRQHRLLPRVFGYLLLALAGLAMLRGLDGHAPPAAVLNAVLINGLLAAAGSLVAACTIDRQRAAVTPGEAIAEPLLIGWGTLWLLGAAAFEIDRFVPDDLRFGAWLAVLAVLGAGYAFACARLRWRAIAMPALAHAPAMALALLLVIDPAAPPWRHGGSWGWPLALAAHGAVLRWAAPQWPAQAARVVHALGFVVLAGWGALAGRALTAEWGEPDSAWRWLGWLVIPALALAALLRPALLQRWPLRLDVTAYRSGAGGVLALGMLAWALLANIVSNGSAQPLPHLPLANPLDLGIGASLLAAWAWWRSDAAAEVARQAPAGTGPAVFGGLAFVWLNGMLVRAFHHWGGVPYHLDDWAASAAVQSGLALLWSATSLALMWWAARRGERVPWLAGAVLLGAVVAKLLLIDLSGSGTVTRIVSFIGVGVLMLVIGYVAPLPAARRNSDAG